MAPAGLALRLSVKLNWPVMTMFVASALFTQLPRLQRVIRSDRTRAVVGLFPVVTRRSPLRLDACRKDLPASRQRRCQESRIIGRGPLRSGKSGPESNL